MREMPQPQRERWQPLRAGFVDVFYYDEEEFHFRDGRLLLRGNNGTGKSKVLALTLPFLLDGELSPHRVEPDADPKKRMEWNLLLGGEHRNDERLGYTWLELGRLDPDAGAQFCTLGCGLKAVSGRGIVSHWFFISDQRVGQELRLADRSRIALTRERLEDAIGARGMLYRTVRDYRRAVDERLFGLGEQRYAALIDLLIKIRAPQLSKRPNERALSDALTQALPPLPQALIADVAEAFRSLEEDRDALHAMVEARDAAQRYLSTYRDYARIAARRRAAPPRQTQSAFESLSRKLAAAEEAHQTALSKLKEAKEALAELEQEHQRLIARERALRESPEARSAAELERAGRESDAAAERAREAQVDHARLSEAADRRRRSLAGLHSVVAADRERLMQALEATQVQAIEAGVGDTFSYEVEAPLARLLEGDAAVDGHRAVEGEARAAEGDGHTVEGGEHALAGQTPQVDVAELQRRAQHLAESRTRALRHVRDLLDKVAERERALLDARRQHDERVSEVGDVSERRGQAAEELAAAGSRLVSAAHSYLEQAKALPVEDPAAVLARLELWVQTLDGPNPFAGAVIAAGRTASGALARAETKIDVQQREADELIAELDASIEALQAGEHEAPPAPHTRDAAARTGRPGAPLWRLVDFRPEVDEGRRAGIEAALEAAGILDAWVSPEGELLAPGTDDVLVRPQEGGATGGACLQDVLVPAIDVEDEQAGVIDERAVESVLAGVGIERGSGATWVTAEGEFCNGVLEGSWRKPAATFIGESARDLARRRRLAELTQRREQAQSTLAGLTEQRAHLVERRDELERQLQEMPADEELRGAHGRLLGLDAERARLLERVTAAAQRLEQVQGETEKARSGLEQTAAELAISTDPQQLDRVGDALQRLDVQLAGMWPACAALQRARDSEREARSDLASQESALAEQEQRLQAAGRAAAEMQERHRALTETVGAAVAELHEKLRDVAHELRENDRRRGAEQQRHDDALKQEGEAQGRRRTLTADVADADERRREAAEDLRRFADTGLIAVALDGIELPAQEEDWNVTRALHLARQIEQALADVPEEHSAWQRAQRRVTDELGALQDPLRRHGNSASATMQEEGITVEIVFRGRSMSVPSLVDSLTEDVAERERLLSEREREILENHLVDEVARTLQELISDAEHRVEETNRELDRRPTSTGMRLRLGWRTIDDGPTGLAEARSRLLRQTADAWAEEDRAAVSAFLQAQIQDVRARDVGGTWIEHLTDALDYRGWHRFAIERHQGGRWRSATGPASGGERVLTASVPLFAAASSYYASAGNREAPRLVMLDEAFAGVDDHSRAKCLGLLAAFDLDVVMTSEREWGCYAEVPGLSIAQLARVADIPAVLVTHWEWDGVTRRRVERPASADADADAKAVAETAKQATL